MEGYNNTPYGCSYQVNKILLEYDRDNKLYGTDFFVYELLVYFLCYVHVSHRLFTRRMGAPCVSTKGVRYTCSCKFYSCRRSKYNKEYLFTLCSTLCVYQQRHHTMYLRGYRVYSCKSTQLNIYVVSCFYVNVLCERTVMNTDYTPRTLCLKNKRLRLSS